MRCFDICRARGLGDAGKDRLVVVLQHEHFSDLATTVVAPLFTAEELPRLSDLRPAIAVGRKNYSIAVDRMASLPNRQLGPAVGTAAGIRFDLLHAIDRLFSGF